MAEFATLQHATYTEAEWTAWDGVLLEGQMAYSSDVLYSGTDQMRHKVGNGTDTWTALDYVPEPTVFTGGNLTSALNEAKGADIASAATTDIGAATGNFVHVTGTTTITALGTVQAGARRTVRFAGALTLTHNATSLILPTGANITTAANDVATFVSEGSGNWRCVNYMRADGSALASGLSGTSNEIAYFNSATSVSSLSTTTYPSLTELSYVKGLTSSVQAQLDSKGYTVSSRFYALLNPTDGATYYPVYVFASNITTAGARSRHKVLKSGTKVNVGWTHSCSAGSNEGVTLYVTNVTTSTTITITSTIDMSASTANNYYLNNSLVYTVGDLIEVSFLCPSWATNPTALGFNVDLQFI